MAKNNNLTDFLTDIADAIRAKKSSTDKINPQNFASEIKSIGASNVGSRPKGYFKVTFIDVDGTVLKTQYVAKGGSATPPDSPTREYCTFVKWVGSYTNVTQDSAVGALYKSSDGKTRYKICVTAGNSFQFASVPSSAVIDWGDGTTNTGTVSHTYTSNFKGWVTSSEVVYPYHHTYDSSHKQKIFDIILPDSVTSIPDYAFQRCYSLQSVVIPDSVTSIGEYAFYACYSLQSIVIPSKVTTPYYMAGDCKVLRSIILSDETTFYKCAFWKSGIQSIIIPSGVKEISYGVFQHCYSLQSIIIPSGVTNIDYQAFSYCYSLQSLCCLATTPPTLANNSLEYTNNLVAIYVPDASVETYKAATNWSSYADKILPISQSTE